MSVKMVLIKAYSVWYYIGVNVIGIPEMTKHQIGVYRTVVKNNYDNRKVKIK